MLQNRDLAMSKQTHWQATMSPPHTTGIRARDEHWEANTGGGGGHETCLEPKCSLATHIFHPYQRHMPCHSPNDSFEVKPSFGPTTPPTTDAMSQRQTCLYANDNNCRAWDRPDASRTLVRCFYFYFIFFIYFTNNILYLDAYGLCYMS
jgi:hypothetical protein